MMTYESFFSKISKYSTQNKLAQAFVDFFNSININLKSYYEYRSKNDDNIWIYLDEHKAVRIHIIKHKTYAYIFEILYYSNNISSFLDDVYFPNNMTRFMLNIFNSDITSFRITKKDVPVIISKLTKENYDLFSNLEKFNL